MFNFNETITEGKKLHSKEVVREILHRTHLPMNDRIIPREHFFKDWYIRENTLDYLYPLYLNNMDLRRVVNEFYEKDATVEDRIWRDMMQVISHGECFVLFISGGTGSGKSTLAQYLVQRYFALNKKSMYIILDPENPTNMIDNKIMNYDEYSKMYITYLTSESNKVFRQLVASWDVVMQDETPKQHGKGSRVEWDNFQNVISVATRSNKISLVLLNPELPEPKRLKNVNYFLEIVGTKRETFETCGILYNKKMHPLGICTFKIALKPEVLEQYEEMSKVRKREILERGGMAGVQTDESELMEKVQIYYNWCVEHNVNTKLKCEKYIKRCPEIANYPDADIVIEETWDRIDGRVRVEWNNEQPPEPTVSPTREVKFTGTFADYAKQEYLKLENANDTTASILYSWLSGVTYKNMADTHGFKSENTVQARLTRIKEVHIGNWFEEFCAINLGVEPVTAHNKHIPDLVIASKGDQKWNYWLVNVINGEARPYDELHVYTIKFDYDMKHNAFEVWKDFWQEASFCHETGIDNLTLLYYGLRNTARRKMEDFENPDDYTFDENLLEYTFKLIGTREVKVESNYTVSTKTNDNK